LFGIADFVREARKEHVDIGAMASGPISHGFEFPIIGAEVFIGVDVKICDIAACAAIVDKVEEIEMRIIWVRIEAPFKIRSACEFEGAWRLVDL
jgi:hypothetical protein